MSSYEKLEMVFGKGCDPMKVADALMDGIEDYSVNDETGENNEWDELLKVEGVAV